MGIPLLGIQRARVARVKYKGKVPQGCLLPEPVILVTLEPSLDTMPLSSMLITHQLCGSALILTPFRIILLGSDKPN